MAGRGRAPTPGPPGRWPRVACRVGVSRRTMTRWPPRGPIEPLHGTAGTIPALPGIFAAGRRPAITPAVGARRRRGFSNAAAWLFRATSPPFCPLARSPPFARCRQCGAGPSIPVHQQVLPSPRRVCRILPVDHVEPSQSVAEVREVEPAVGVVMREVAGLRPVGPDMDDREGLVRKRVDVCARPRLGPDRRRDAQRLDRRHHETAGDGSMRRDHSVAPPAPLGEQTGGQSRAAAEMTVALRQESARWAARRLPARTDASGRARLEHRAARRPERASPGGRQPTARPSHPAGEPHRHGNAGAGRYLTSRSRPVRTS